MKVTDGQYTQTLQDVRALANQLHLAETLHPLEPGLEHALHPSFNAQANRYLT